MKRKLIASIGAAVLILSLAAGSALAAADAQTAPANLPDRGTMGFGGKGGTRAEMTDEQKAEMEAQRAEREAKIAAFLATLTTGQKALYDAATPAAPAKDATAEGRRQMPDEAAMTAMKEKQEAFVASLTESQKAAYQELFSFQMKQPRNQSSSSASTSAS